jgi:hypothetical protein
MDNTMTGYSTLFDIAIAHDYFIDGACPSVQIVPAAGCADLMRGYGMIWRTRPGRIHVSGAASGWAALRREVAASEGGLVLGFEMRSTDQYFDEYTALPMRSGELLWFDSRQATAPADGRRMLHATGRVADTSFVRADAPALAGLLTGPLLPLALVQVVLAPGPDGLCAGTLAPARRRFGVHFGANALYWKYYLLGALRERPLFIRDLDDAVAFQEQARVDLPAAAVFLSQAPIALRDVPSQRFELRERDSFGDKVVIKRMPNARVGRRQRELVDGHAVLVSEIFINQ